MGGLFILLGHSFMGGFLLGYNLPQPLLGKETPSLVLLSCPSHFGQQMRVLSCNAVSFSTFFILLPSMPALLLVNPKEFLFVPG